MRMMDGIVSQKCGKRRMTDKELAERVLQYVPDAYSMTTLRVMCASTRYLSYIGLLQWFFDVDLELVRLTDSCKFFILIFMVA